MKKLLKIIILIALLVPMVSFGQITVPQGGTGTTTFPTNWFLTGSSATRVTATGTPFFQNYSAVNGTTTNSTSTRLSVTTAFNFLGTVITNVDTWFSGLFDSNLSTKTTDNLTEGATNKYDETVVLTQGGATTITGTYPNFTITSTDNTASTTLLANNNTFSGLNQFTNAGTTTFTGGISASRYDSSATSTFAGLVIDAGGLKISTINCSASNELLQTDASGNVICGTDDGAGGGSASTTLLADNNTWSGTNNFGALTVDGFTLDLTGNSSLTGTNSGDVTLTGENYLSLSGQQITANAINPDNLASADFGAFTCNGTNCSLDTAYLTSYDAWTHPSAGVSATTSSMIFTNASSTFTGNLNISGNSTTTNLAVSSLTSALVITNSAGSAQEYTGTTCTNQFVRSLSVLGAATCATVANTDLANSTISGIALGSNLADLTATNGTLTFSGTYNGGTARTIGLNLSNANNWTALQTFANASSTLFSAGRAWFGGTATTTIDTAGNLVIPSGSNLTITGKTDGCATFASGVLNSTGSACGSGGGAGAQASTTATYIMYKQGTTYYAYNSTTTAVTSNSDFSTLLQSLVNVIDAGNGGGIIHIKAGVYYNNATTTIEGNGNAFTDNAERVTIQGEGQEATLIVTNSNSDFLDFDNVAITSVKDLGVYVKGSSRAFVADSLANNVRSMWQFEFKNIFIGATTTTTSVPINLGNVLRGTFENMEFFETNGCARFYAEGTLNPGDFTWTRSFCELNNTADVVAYDFQRDSTGFMNQVYFTMAEGIGTGTGQKFINAEYLDYSDFSGLNAEQFDVLVDITEGASNKFHFNYATHRTGVASLRACRFWPSANNNLCEFGFLNGSANYTVVDDMNTFSDAPNTIIGYIGQDSGTASASTSASTVTIIRDIKGYGTIDTTLAPGGRLGKFDIQGGLFQRASNATSTFAGAVFVGSTSPASTGAATFSVKGIMTVVAQFFTSSGTKVMEILDSGLVTLLGSWDFGGATFLEIPNGTAPTANDVGEIAHDTTGNQLIVDDYVMANADQIIWSRTVGSTTPEFISAGLMSLPTRLDGFTITRIQCHVLGGTSKVIAIEDASANSSEDITCATTNTTDDGSITNATYTASELANIDFGATTGAVNYVNITVYGQWTRE